MDVALHDRDGRGRCLERLRMRRQQLHDDVGRRLAVGAVHHHGDRGGVRREGDCQRGEAGGETRWVEVAHMSELTNRRGDRMQGSLVGGALSLSPAAAA